VNSAAPIRFQIAFIGEQEARQVLTQQQQAAVTTPDAATVTPAPAMAYAGGW